MIYVLLTWLAAPILYLRLWLRGAPAAPHRVLLIQTAKIGDLLCSTPMLRALKQRHPQAEIHVLAHPVTAPLLRSNPNVAQVLEAQAGQFKGLAGKLRLTRLLRTGRYDAVICLNAALAYPVCALWALVPVRLAVLPNFCGTAYRLATRFWSGVEGHRSDRLIQHTYLALLGHLGVANGSIDKDVYTAPGAREKVCSLLGEYNGPWIGIGVSSANKLKELGTAKIAAIAAGLLSVDAALRVVLIGSSADRDQATAVRALLPLRDRVTDGTGRLALTELPALLEQLSAYVGVDSGITYMADAVGTAIVSVAGPCNMAETRPLNGNVIIIQRDLPCAPCAHIYNAPYHCRTGTHACIEEVGAEEVVAAARQLLDAVPRRRDGKSG